MYMLCLNDKLQLPLDFDLSLKALCSRWGLHYGSVRNALTRYNGAYKGYLIEYVIIDDYE